MGHYNFKEDLAVAQKIEERVIIHMMKVKPDMRFHGFVGLKGYDAHFTLDDKYHIIEIKSDYFTEKTGNIVIEYASRGKASGIETTQANLWAYAVITKLGLDIYLFNTAVIKRLIKNELYERTMIGGDIRSNTKLYVFKLEKVVKHAIKLEERLEF